MVQKADRRCSHPGCSKPAIVWGEAIGPDGKVISCVGWCEEHVCKHEFHPVKPYDADPTRR